MTENELIQIMGSASIFSEDALAHSRGMMCHTVARCSMSSGDLADSAESVVASSSSEAQMEQGWKTMIEAAVGEGSACNELLLSLLKARPAWGSLYRDTSCSLLRQCVGPALDNKQIWKQAWATNRHALIYGIQDMCRQDPSCVDDFVEALRAVADVGEALHLCEDAAFKVDFAFAAHNAGALSFSKWMSGAVAREGGEAVALECMDLATKRYQGQQDTRCDRIKTETLVPLVKSLQLMQHTSGEFLAAHERLRSASRGRLLGGVGQTQGTPGTAPGAPAQGAPGAVVAPGAVGAAGGGVPGVAVGEPGQQQGQQQQSALFAADIEEEANSHFQRIYTNKLQIEGVIQMLKGFKTSSNQVRLLFCLFCLVA